MKAIILTGGRGKRLGALTKNLQKGALSFNGNPLICHTLSSLTNISGIGEMFILTGYRGEDIEQIIFSRFSAEKIRLLHFPAVMGNLSRLSAAFTQIDIINGCFVCGIDSLIPVNVAQRFLTFSAQNNNYPLLLLSPRLKTALTHSLVVFREGAVVSYQNLKRKGTEDFGRDFYIDAGFRYFPASFCQLIKKEGIFNKRYIPHFISEAVRKGRQFSGLTFTESWRHFSSARDFCR
ncbi:MAG: hypothetical protein A3J65_03625 [Candidatus Buchananbacteria bacterium RIFCSPHIGHO2_02_FULL_45_11b]|uniref:Nucleotidyl transferase domain-containing protein n=4 Tax=Candidatus Buchananiibacteriota TaxID=1817903 RepID=A0A1G1YAV8_9BACT|nr:MAG: hypothetical protein A2663_03365 [Candidatus Buchananbacteria bacterium RIFCSPHIGHO2_01_FULL_46_12]OGY50756.1 MAG: hypothetical protein A3J65_03625 [Candidatus Buchananbacteria bacterium RIFCSPHIGHO2_02_FULL_45_11b]OGY53302.1 MAG: hypothetical protein A3B15_03175 [Candidatus Buchananbacteria bacterium RIFCSPLOWO2_01_FULL_45_31]OGY55749.1 MAG: hypothetical protein A3H67_02520 [Candidatus Buchananbacteria bacterium RIFCSPLOWO2_02_FULL_46_11b]